ncbi:hypothetical protein [Actinomadura montaniterrae]|uniref:hypothetical protein n=1 Tax=Actinomadura montaniterrae TaxID=1803903 RepID=UPI00178C8259|nr:hypothetical protein [Actinomadura montaniterrae]
MSLKRDARAYQRAERRRMAKVWRQDAKTLRAVGRTAAAEQAEAKAREYEGR